MKLQRTTLILLASALLLGGFVYVYEIRGASEREAVKTTKEPIFTFKEDQIQSLTIYIDEKTLEFERVSGQQTNWRMKKPEDVPASDAAIAFLLNLVAEGKSDRSFPIQRNQLQEYGLDKPSATVKVQLKNQQIHWLMLGKADFNRSFLYAQANPSTQTPPLKVLLVPIDFEYAVNRPMSEWQSKPENSQTPKSSPSAETPKSSPTPGSPKPSPTAETPKPSPTAETPKPLPTAETPKPSPSAETPKPLPTAETPKPSPTAESLKPSPTAESPKPSSTQGRQ